MPATAPHRTGRVRALRRFQDLVRESKYDFRENNRLRGTLVSQTEKRKSIRKEIRHLAWIAMAQPGKLKECFISDVSQTGARIDVENPKELPNEFMLFLTRNASMRRKCQVMWRNGTQLGVHFDRPRSSTR